MTDEVIHNGWSEARLREALALASPKAQAIISYVAAHPRCPSAEIATALGLKSERSVGPALDKGFTHRVRHLGVRDADDWPVEFSGRSGTYNLFDMNPRLRAIALEVLGHR